MIQFLALGPNIERHWSDSPSAPFESLRHRGTDFAEHVESLRLVNRLRIGGHQGARCRSARREPEAAEPFVHQALAGVDVCWE